MEGNQLSIS